MKLYILVFLRKRQRKPRTEEESDCMELFSLILCRTACSIPASLLFLQFVDVSLCDFGLASMINLS